MAPTTTESPSPPSPAMLRTRASAKDNEPDLPAAAQDTDDDEFPIITFRAGLPVVTYLKDSKPEYNFWKLLSREYPILCFLIMAVTIFYTFFNQLGDELGKLVGHTSVKRRKLELPKENQLLWIDRLALVDLTQQYREFAASFSIVWKAVTHTTSRQGINETLQPLSLVLSENAIDLQLLNDGGHHDLCRLFEFQCEQAFGLLEKVYEVGRVIQFKDQYPVVPLHMDENPSAGQLEMVKRIKNFMSAPALSTICKDILATSGSESAGVSTDFMNRVVLDMEAIIHKLPMPSYISSSDFHEEFRRRFPSPQRLDLDNVVLPGIFPEVGGEIPAEKQPAMVPESHCEPSPPSTTPEPSVTTNLHQARVSEDDSLSTPEPKGTPYVSEDDSQKSHVTGSDSPKAHVSESQVGQTSAGDTRSVLTNKRKFTEAEEEIPAPTPVLKSHCEPSPTSTLKPKVTEKDSPKAHVRESYVGQKSAGETRAGNSEESKPHGAARSTSTTDSEAKYQPRAKVYLRPLRSILQDRAIRKLRRSSVSFAESTSSQQQRTDATADTSGSTNIADLIMDNLDYFSQEPESQGTPPVSRQVPKPARARIEHDGKERMLSSEELVAFGKARALRLRSTNGVRPEEKDTSNCLEQLVTLPSLEPLKISDESKTEMAEMQKAAVRASPDWIRKVQSATFFPEQKEVKKRSTLADVDKRMRECEARLARPRMPVVAPLSEEWMQKAINTLSVPSELEMLATTGRGVMLRRHEFSTLVPSTEWLNDEIVNGCLEWLEKEVNLASGKKRTRRCLVMNSFFWPKIEKTVGKRTQSTLRRMGVDKKSFLYLDSVLIPICKDNHWTLLVVRPRKRRVSHMDSLKPAGQSTYPYLAMAWLKDFLEDEWNAAQWDTELAESPRQTNGYDCGVHVITNGMCVALGIDPMEGYSSDEMPLQRFRLAAMLLNGGFKGDFDLWLPQSPQ